MTNLSRKLYAFRNLLTNYCKPIPILSIKKNLINYITMRCTNYRKYCINKRMDLVEQ